MGKKNSKLSVQEVEELTQLTYFSPQEIKSWYRGFLNDCPSGHLDQEEFCSIYSRFFPFGDASLFASNMFNTFDSDQNGFIDFKTFVVGLSSISRGSLEDKLSWSFRLFDVDQDGYISREEMEKAMESTYKMVGGLVEFPEGETSPQMRVNHLFEVMDTKGEGRISLDAFLAAMTKDSSVTQAISFYGALL